MSNQTTGKQLVSKPARKRAAVVQVRTLMAVRRLGKYLDEHVGIKRSVCPLCNRRPADTGHDNKRNRQEQQPYIVSNFSKKKRGW